MAVGEPKTPTGLTGVSGEYFTVAELSRRGWLATVTIKNSPGTDVLAQKLDAARLVAIQTKATRQGNSSFLLNAKDERLSSTDEWYVFVSLGALDVRPDFYVVPRNVVAGRLYSVHRDWLAKPSKGGKPHQDSAVRDIPEQDLQPWREKWELLDVPAAEARFIGPPSWIDLAHDVPHPDGYPGFGLSGDLG